MASTFSNSLLRQPAASCEEPLVNLIERLSEYVPPEREGLPQGERQRSGNAIAHSGTRTARPATGSRMTAGEERGMGEGQRATSMNRTGVNLRRIGKGVEALTTSNPLNRTEQQQQQQQLPLWAFGRGKWFRLWWATARKLLERSIYGQHDWACPTNQISCHPTPEQGLMHMSDCGVPLIARSLHPLASSLLLASKLTLGQHLLRTPFGWGLQQPWGFHCGYKESLCATKASLKHACLFQDLLLLTMTLLAPVIQGRDILRNDAMKLKGMNQKNKYVLINPTKAVLAQLLGVCNDVILFVADARAWNLITLIALISAAKRGLSMNHGGSDTIRGQGLGRQGVKHEMELVAAHEQSLQQTGPDSLIGADEKRGGWGWSGRAVIGSNSVMVELPKPISGADGAVMRPHERPGDCPIGHNGDDGAEMEQQQKRGGWTKKTISPTV
ncbi:uncharacterized protein An11g01530 [Aspergillus niger]|uniref:Contig An11c0050, genomic contig n=2 Tax=Aspergillus niger TaxID=5061 RepID=A2QVI3_ASPNC|nr:uncharacterized protein An11g01530 [Aspergillus niger]CAK45887.1 unnamed protein product [Aspergillus niger]